jgi:K+-transporting ATPase A subunit
MTIRNILWLFGIIYGLLVWFVVILYIIYVLVCLDQEKSGNPAMKHEFADKT